jgi:hypothetical protein
MTGTDRRLLAAGLLAAAALATTAAATPGRAQTVATQTVATQTVATHTEWSMMTSPVPGANSGLSAVQATPTTAPWAVGEWGSQDTVQRALVFRCR